jgi:hypothetical protein
MSGTEATARDDRTMGTRGTKDEVATETNDVRDNAARRTRDDIATETGDNRDADQIDAGHAGHAGSAAERLGGPSERDDRREMGDASGPDFAARPGADDAHATLIPAERAESYHSRWNELKGEFVDEPRGAVRRANELVGEVLDELEELFRSQRADLERGLDSEQTTTEDLRQALGRYRSFFDRLLSF